MIVAILFGLFGAAALSGIYKAFELRWPDAYESLNNTFALDVVQSWWRLVAFRVVPVFIVGLGISVTTQRLGGLPAVAIAVMIGIHAAVTNGRVISQAFWRGNGREFRVNHGSYHASALALLVVAGVVVGFATVPLAGLVPKPSVLLESLWTALLVAIAAGALIALIGKPTRRGFESDEDYYAWRATRDVGLNIVDDAFAAAVAHGSDPVLIRALMFTEVLQRPRWVRNLERLFGHLVGKGSYGVTQVKAKRPITDREALAITAASLSSRWGIVRGEHGWHVDDGAIWQAVGSYNGEAVFIDAVQRLYRGIFYKNYQLGVVDDAAMYRTLEVRRYEDGFGVRFVTDAMRVDFLVRMSDTSIRALTHQAGKASLHAGEIRIPTTAISIEVCAWAGDGHPAMTSFYLPPAKFYEPEVA